MIDKKEIERKKQEKIQKLKKSNLERTIYYAAVNLIIGFIVMFLIDSMLGYLSTKEAVIWYRSISFSVTFFLVIVVDSFLIKRDLEDDFINKIYKETFYKALTLAPWFSIIMIYYFHVYIGRNEPLQFLNFVSNFINYYCIFVILLWILLFGWAMSRFERYLEN